MLNVVIERTMGETEARKLGEVLHAKGIASYVSDSREVESRRYAIMVNLPDQKKAQQAIQDYRLRERSKEAQEQINTEKLYKMSPHDRFDQATIYAFLLWMQGEGLQVPENGDGLFALSRDFILWRNELINENAKKGMPTTY